MSRLRPEISALAELGLLFSPAIPAYIWLWPNVSGTDLFYAVQAAVYIYVLGGVLFIGLRRWAWDQLGLNWRGMGLSLVCGAVLLAERLLAQRALGLPLGLRPIALWRIVGEVAFYFGLVGLVEELLFRGLIFRALENWRGPDLAILGSSLGFALWHVGWMGLLVIAPFLLGLLFGLIRWRAGGIVGLIAVHGLFDIVGVETATPVPFETIGQLLQIRIADPLAVVVGDALFLGMILFLWKIQPRLVPGRRDGHAGNP